MKNKIIEVLVLSCLVLNIFFPVGIVSADEVEQNISDSSEIVILPDPEIIDEQVISIDENVSTTTEEVATSSDGLVESSDFDAPIITPPTRTIKLKIITDSDTIFDNQITFEACKVKDTDAEAVFSAYCAISKADVGTVWNFDYGPAYLDSISGVGNDYALNKYWLYFKNLEFGFSSYDQEILSDEDSLLVENNIYPLKISVGTTTPVLNSTTTINISEFGFVGWDGVWMPSATSTLFSSFNNEQYEIGQSGSVDVSISTTTPITFYATKNGFVNSDELTIYPTNNAVVSTITATTTTTTTGGGGSGSTSHNTPDKEKMLAFLDTHQKDDGSFGGDLYTDWVAMAYGSSSGHTTAKNKLKEFLKSDGLSRNSSVTDYERRAMALMALGINPYTGGAENYIAKIINSFDGTQFGDPDLFNDDVFAIITLRSAGYFSGDNEIIKARDFIISKQEGNGSFDSPDITSATIQSLKLVDETSASIDAINKAKNYILGLQVPDGGFTSVGGIGNNFSTSWILGALGALSISGESLVNNNKNPFDYLYSLQQNDGGIEDDTTQSIDTRVWATAYATVGSQEKTWNAVMKSFSKNIESTITSNGGGDTTYTATSSPEVVAISDIVVATTTKDQIIDTNAEKRGDVLGIQTDKSNEETDFYGSRTTINSPETDKSNLAFAGNNQNKFTLWFGSIAILGGVLILIRKWSR